MAWAWSDGFELTRSAAGIARDYEGTTNPSSAFSFVTGALQGFAMHCGTSGVNAIFRTPALAAHATRIVKFRFKNTSTSTVTDLVKVMDGTSNVNCKLVLTPGASTYTISLVVGSTTVATSAALSNGTWYYLELKVLLATGATGTYSFRVGEVVDFSGTATVTASVTATSDRVQFQLPSPSDIDDIDIYDGSGSDHNDLDGDMVIEGLLPIADVVVSGTGIFPTSPTTHFDKVDDPATSAPDDAGSYVYSTADAQKDIYAFGSLAFITANIKGVRLKLEMALSSSGTRNVKAKYRNTAGTEAASTAVAVNSPSYAPPKNFLYAQQPVAAAAWTPADINNTGAGQNGFGFETGS